MLNASKPEICNGCENFIGNTCVLADSIGRFSTQSAKAAELDGTAQGNLVEQRARAAQETAIALAINNPDIKKKVETSACAAGVMFMADPELKNWL